MPSALYYPHIQVQDESLIRTSLLLWDKLEFIAPYQQEFFRNYSGQYARAMELIGVARVPSLEEKQLAHSTLEQFIGSGLPESFYHPMLYSPTHRDLEPEYRMYMDKLLPQTWHMLQNKAFAKIDGENYSVSKAFGLLAMSVIADVCAGSQLAKVTDQELQYEWLARLTTNQIGATPVLGPIAAQGKYERLVAISIKGIGTDNIPINSILKMRERELRGDGSDYRRFRRKYLDEITKCVKVISTQAKSVNDVGEIEREFQRSMAEDFADLQRELNLESSRSILQKDVVTLAIAGAAALLVPVAGVTVLGALSSLASVSLAVRNYQENQRNALLKHPMSWLYLNRTKSLGFMNKGYIF